MRAVLEEARTGLIHVCDVPEPELRSGGILVRTAFSAISAGTEKAKLQTSEKSLVGKALARPDLVRQVVDFARTNGLRAAYQKVQSRLDTLTPLGYSCAGVVLAVGQDVSEFRVGDHVACAGGGYASHSEINFVPVNLAARVPHGLGLDVASLTTVGAIAMHGLRQSHATFGETVVVIGAGLVGVLTAQLARAAGCRVIALDADAHRAGRAAQLGAHAGLTVDDPTLGATLRELAPHGADVAIITAATRSAEPMELAARLLRDRGRIVIVGDVGMGVSRHNMYHKELSMVMSRSYGPGRYDPGYEEEGSDYPIGYVRWTEKRNMEAFLAFAASGAIDPRPLIECRHSIDDAAAAYAELRRGQVYTALLSYPAITGEPQEKPAVRPSPPPRQHGTLRVGCIGAGSFARTVIIPALRSLKNVELEAVATSSGVAAENARRSFGFSMALTPAALIDQAGVDSLFVLSRHESHARYVGAALRRRLPVFVEKPLAVTFEELQELVDAYRQQSAAGADPFVMVGFNRRFAPMTQKLRGFFAGRREPMLVHARVNAGFLPLDHWTQHEREGGRIVGEMCHFIDWARAVVGCPIVDVWARSLPDVSRYNRDNVAATFTFADGSLANVLYLANGDRAVDKEYFEVFCEGKTACLNDFVELTLAFGGKSQRISSRRDKGHQKELQLTVEAMRTHTPAPIPFEELVEVTDAALKVRTSLVGAHGDPERVLSAAASAERS